MKECYTGCCTRVHKLCRNHPDDEIRMEDLRLHEEGDNEVLRHRHT